MRSLLTIIIGLVLLLQPFSALTSEVDTKEAVEQAIEKASEEAAEKAAEKVTEIYPLDILLL
jgi:hypothetical protein